VILTGHPNLCHQLKSLEGQVRAEVYIVVCSFCFGVLPFQPPISYYRRLIAMAPASTESLDREFKIAKKLAHSGLLLISLHSDGFIDGLILDKRIRDKAFSLIKTAVSSRRAISDEDLLKLWKALFYCMWMSDKPKVQEELADNIASITTLFPDNGDMGIKFIKAFWTTMIIQWHGIDRLR
jgi:hypothetical protein